MTSAYRIKCTCGFALAVALALPLAPSKAAAPGNNADAAGVKSQDKTATKKSATDKTVVNLFDAMKSGDLDVKYVARNSREGQLLVTNNTDQPLTVKLPDAFAAVPVLAQGGIGGGAGNRTNRSTSTNNNNQNQGVGGGGGGYGGGGNRGGGGGGAFDVAPEKVAKIKLETVCLEHGKKEPSANVPYEIRPIDTFTSDTNVQELCKLLGTGQISQRAAQAAAWHLANHMTWEQLVDKKIHHLLGGDEVYFSKDEIRAAMQITDRAIKLAEAAAAASAATSVSASAGKN